MTDAAETLAMTDHSSPPDWPANSLSDLDETSSHVTEIRQELSRVLNSTQFDASDRNRRFLEYVVEETLAGRGARIKAYNIATEVFGRGIDFDPQLDPVVRMEARRLRRSLERFYLIDGNSSLVRIAIPKGGYVAEFVHLPLASPAADTGLESSSSNEPAASQRWLAIQVTPFEAEGDQSVFKHFNRGFTEEVIIGLARHPDISVFRWDPRLQSASSPENKPSSMRCEVEYILTGAVALYAGLVSGKALLVHAGTGRVVWGECFERELRPGNILNVRDQVAHSIVAALVQPYGIIFNTQSSAARAKDPRNLSPLESILKYYEYRKEYRHELFELAHDCLRRTVDGNPDYAEAIACLSHLATDGHRFGFAPAESFARLRRQAAELAHKAVGLSSQSSRGHHALGWSYWFAHDASASLKALQTALALNSNATEVMADLGLVWSLLGEWERGVPLLEEAWMRQPSQRGVSCFGLSLYHFMNGRYGDALTYANAVEMPDLAHGLVVRAISLVRLGRKAEAAQAVDGILSMAPYSGQHRLAELAGAHVNPALAEGVLSALADAGLRTDRTQH